jgi:hypothetical protein
MRVELGRVSRAAGFDEARGFATLLAGIRIFDELKERSFGLDSQKLLQESAFCGNFRQAPAKQTIELETRRPGCANAPNISLISHVKPVAGEGNSCVSARVSKIIDTTEDDLSVVISRRCPDQAMSGFAM